MPELHQHLRKCSLCSEDVQLLAVKCRHCGGYQGRWVFLNLSAPVLGLLVALISVVALSVPVFVSLTSQDNSDVRVEFQSFQDGAVYFVASNLGTRPGTVSEAYLDFSSKPEPERIYLKGDPKKQFIEPNSSRQLMFEIPCRRDEVPAIHYRENAKFGSRPLASDTRIQIVTIQFDGRRETKTVQIGYLSGIRAINDKLHRCLSDQLRGVEKG